MASGRNGQKPLINAGHGFCLLKRVGLDALFSQKE